MLTTFEISKLLNSCEPSVKHERVRMVSLLPLPPAVYNLIRQIPVCAVLCHLYKPLLSRDLNRGIRDALESPKKQSPKIGKCIQEIKEIPSVSLWPSHPGLLAGPHTFQARSCLRLCAWTFPWLGMFHSQVSPSPTLLPSSCLCSYILTN